VGTSEDMAQMAGFLLGDKSSWISGQIFHVDGGMSTLLVNA
jgi:enoyl-[acyl-carrier-protein] reductase (NADH)